MPINAVIALTTRRVVDGIAVLVWRVLDRFLGGVESVLAQSGDLSRTSDSDEDVEQKEESDEVMSQVLLPCAIMHMVQ